jgi:hypothetical protein
MTYKAYIENMEKQKARRQRIFWYLPKKGFCENREMGRTLFLRKALTG